MTLFTYMHALVSEKVICLQYKIINPAHKNPICVVQQDVGFRTSSTCCSCSSEVSDHQQILRKYRYQITSFCENK